MDKFMKTGLIVVAVAAAAYLVMKNSKSANKASSTNTVTPLTQEEKDFLFSTAMGYRGGAPPTPEILAATNAAAEEAKAKIIALGLQAEFEAYVQSQIGIEYPAANGGGIGTFMVNDIATTAQS